MLSDIDFALRARSIHFHALCIRYIFHRRRCLLLPLYIFIDKQIDGGADILFIKALSEDWRSAASD